MLEPLLPHYERELRQFRDLAGAFAERYPKVARRLRIDPPAPEDPHVERLIEGFALLAARIHRKLDDECPGITEAFLRVLHPQDLRPVPAATILQLAGGPGPGQPGPRTAIPRGTVALSPEIQGIRCGFRTTQDLDLWPVTVVRAALEPTPGTADTPALLTLDLATPEGLPFPRLGLDRLRFFLDGEPPLMHLLYELLLFRVQSVTVAGDGDAAKGTGLPASALRPVGFGGDEALLQDEEPSFPGFRLLSEYFAFPDKFMFVDLTGLEPAVRRLGCRMRVGISLSRFGAGERHLRLAQTLSAANFRLGCVPVVNLFRHPAEPILVTHRQPSYPVLPEGRQPATCEVYAIDSVDLTVRNRSGESTRAVPPFHAIRRRGQEPRPGLYWHAAGAPRVELTLVELDFQALRPGRETLSLQLTCTDRHLPERLPFGGGSAVQEDFILPGHPWLDQARPLRKPTPSRPPARQGLQRRLILHLALGQLPLAGQGREALQELLRLYQPGGSPAVARQIQGIRQVQSGPAAIGIPGRESTSRVQGTDLHITFDESCYVGSSLYLFATVLERFFGQLCGPNTFVQFRMSTCQQEGEVARWPPRSSESTLT